jgi:anti-sigma B factor antagonist
VTVSVDTTGPGTTFVVRGELDVLTTPELNVALDGAQGDVVLDLSAVTFVDSSGLALILRQRRAVRARGARLQVVGPTGRALQAFRLAGLADVLQLA